LFVDNVDRLTCLGVGACKAIGGLLHGAAAANALVAKRCHIAIYGKISTPCLIDQIVA
jgi:hypothetical protein